MSDFRFAEPEWIHTLWLVVALALGLVLFERRGGRRLADLVSGPLQARLVVGPSAGQRYARHGFAVAACVFAVFALMRPQWGFEYMKSPRASAELMIAIDVSRSMLAEDVAPNRLERAKSEIRDLLEFLVGDQVGLIAFAGRASVLAPMTPDFGFFRLVLDGLGPNSVGRGGTRLEEPIRKAIAGFRATGDISRVLLLITDGEDQDSFPLEAAKEAALRGIRIVAIGFGSESGSEIPITDPETGARTLLRDGNGDIVRTRLDGDTLREMALLTDGVYVPAGVGSLDLEAIYEQHIAGLMRAEIESEGRVIRSEGYQWFVLAALVCLAISVLIGQGRSNRRAGNLLRTGVAVLLVAGSPQLSRAQPTSATPAPSSAEAPESGEDVAPSAGDVPAAAEAGETPRDDLGDPRENYNQALAAFEVGSLDLAKQRFENARAAAATDGEARYRATYGLGYVAVAEADAALDAEPQAALDALTLAADFFREAVRLQPANDDARHNLEIVMRRARVLADSLAKTDEKELAAALDELIERQRGAAGEVRALLEVIAAADANAQTSDAFRRDYRRLSTGQRQLLSDSDRFAERVARERSQLEAVPEAERAAEDAIRIVQLQQLEIFLSRARERMGHSRRELRGRRGERAHRRANAALSELKRARDQLRDPVQILDALLQDGTELARYTQAMAVVGAAGSGIVGGAAAPEAPPWLSFDVLREDQQSLGERTAELDDRLRAGLQHAAQQPAPEPMTPEEAQAAQQRERTLAQVAAASPFLEVASNAFDRAGIALDVEDASQAVQDQRAALAALAQARERFLDLRRLIELAYVDQQRLQQGLDPEDEEVSQQRSENRAELLPALREAQQRNLSRTDRLASLIDQERQALPPAEALASASEEEAAQVEQAREQFDLADQILVVTASSMEGVTGALADSPEADWPAAIVAGDQAVRGLESLRRLFFSIIEHLRDTARRQVELADDTEEVAALAEEDRPRRLGPLVPRQQELAEVSGVIANALEAQSREQPGDLVGGVDPNASQDEQQLAQQAEQLRRAAELVLAAQVEMEDGGKNLAAEPSDFTQARVSQDQAVEHLLAALELLTPPQQQQDQAQQQQEQQQQEQQQQQGGEQEQPEAQEAEADPSQLLQEVRDREAERRRENAERQSRGFDTVERDW